MIIKRPADEEAATIAASKVCEVYKVLINEISVGMKIAAIDKAIMRILESLKCKSCFYKYRIPGNPPFPSQACLSVNNCIIHGTAGYYEEPLKPGDLLKVDIGVSYRGWIGDAGWTFAIREYPSEQAKRLMETGKRSLAEGIQSICVGKPVSDFSAKVQQIIESEGFHVCEALGGHGYGQKLHEPPHISNRVDSPSKDGRLLWQDGMLIAVEPMLAVGTSRIAAKQNQWPVFTADGSLSVHYEADVLVKESGPKILTTEMTHLPDIIG